MNNQNSESAYSKEFFEEQLELLKKQQKGMGDRINQLESILKSKNIDSNQEKQISLPSESAKPQPSLSQSQNQIIEKESISKTDKSIPPVNFRREDVRQKKQRDMELNFGRYWLNKIGVIVFTLGIGFLISYTFKYFTPVLKISFGYLVCAVLFGLGIQLEKKKKLMHFGRVLLGGAWAMTYFTTFAMHHFEASRIIQSQWVDTFLLAIVAVGMVLHSMRYKSETMTSMAIFVAYITATLGAITNFTFMSCLFLSVVILILAYKYQWMKVLFLGVGLTYFVHYFWIIPNINDSFLSIGASGLTTSLQRESLSFIFLNAYWLVFMLGLHLIKGKEIIIERKVAVANFLNFLFFYTMAYPALLDLFYENCFSVILGLGLIYLIAAFFMKLMKRQKVYVADLIIGIMVVTLSIPLKFLPDVTLLIWIIEIPFLLAASFLFREKILRYMSYFLSLIFFFRFTFLCVFPEMNYADVLFIWFNLHWYEFIYLMAAFSFGFCGVYGEMIRRKEELPIADVVFNHIYSSFSFFYLTSFMCLILDKPSLSLGLVGEFFILYSLSFLFALRRLRVYGYLLLPIFLVRNFFIDDFIPLRGWKWMVMGIEILSLFVIYYANRSLLKRQALGLKKIGVIPLFHLPLRGEGFVVLASALILVIGFIYKYMQWQWISLALGIAGVCIIAEGIIDKDKVMRVTGLFFFVLTLLRVIFIDLSDLDMIFKIISFIILGGIFLVISFIYNNYMGETKDLNKS